MVSNMKTGKNFDATVKGEYSNPTCRWIESASLKHRKELGQYMTPATLRERLLDQCDLRPGIRVLDPGVGTGEFLASVMVKEPRAKTYGWDIDKTVLSVASEVVPQATLLERSALTPHIGDPFDLVIGNPPYFQFRASPDIRRHYGRVISGRVNIFALFFQVGLELLNLGGQLAFVVPPSMNNGAYFNNLRNYILDYGAVEFLEVYSDYSLFSNAQTPVQLIVIRRGAADRGKHTYPYSDPSNGFRRTLFFEDPQHIRRLFRNGNTLHQLGYEAVTGTVVWNQHKGALRRSPSRKTVPLIWAHNIMDASIVLVDNHRRPQYIETELPPMVGPAIVANRITGSVGSGALKCALIPEDIDLTNRCSSG